MVKLLIIFNPSVKAIYGEFELGFYCYQEKRMLKEKKLY